LVLFVKKHQANKYTFLLKKKPKNGSMNLKGKKMLVALIHHRPHDMAKFEKKKRRGEQKTNNETSVTLSEANC